jgi:ribonuclease HI
MDNLPALSIEVSPITPIGMDVPPVPEALSGKIPPSDFYCYIDGSCKPNPGQMHAGILLQYKNSVIFSQNYPGGLGTNNEAEFCALIQAFKVLHSVESSQHPAGKVPVVIVSDSRTLVCAILGEYQLKQARLKTRLVEAKQWQEKLTQPHQIVWTSRKHNLAHLISQNLPLVG